MLEQRSINQLYNKQFFIPHYQRGYRWTDVQVKQLLDDIDSFTPIQIPAKPGEHTFYCLQPIAVQLLSEDVKAKYSLNGDWYEVIDGQQRLTTIFLILQYINQKWRGEDKLEKFTLFYETRLGSADFLSNLRINPDNTVTISKEYIDYYYFSKALQTIRAWQINYHAEKGKELTTSDFETKFLKHSKIIWYEVPEQDGRKLFERLNLGKIPLTNAELVKALFLSSESFKDLPTEERKIKQFEVARLWDEIEHKLNEEDLKFWSFITNKKRDNYETKIELILDMITDKPENEKESLFTFLSLIKLKNESKDEKGLSVVWDKIRDFHNILTQWYSNKIYYHKIGYLIASRHHSKYEGVKLDNLVNSALKETKEVFMKIVDEHIKDSVKVELSELRYDEPKHHAQIFNVLLLSNVITCLKSEAIIEFYPFKLHKDNKWSFEHIHARKSENFDKSKKEPWLKWLDIHKILLEELRTEGHNVNDLLEEINTFNKSDITWERFSSIFKNVNNFFTHELESMDKESEGLRNLALLSQPDNSALNNSVFEVKRREIIQLDKEGHFIPVCTKRAFLKYYNDEKVSSQNYFWASGDRENYYNAMLSLLSGYLPVSSQINEIEDYE
jgi:uncharacterized protein with ParB-like and HNH nuclease domain